MKTTMLASVLFAHFLTCDAESADDLRNWFCLEGNPTQDQIRCANLSSLSWVVALEADGLKIASSDKQTPQDILPFELKELFKKIPAGSRHVIEIDDGWLVGFDNGEFIGSLW